MKSTFFKKIGAAITCAAIISSSLVISTGAATGLKNLIFGPCDTGAEVYYVSGGTKTNVDNQDVMFVDGNNKMIWRIPINKSATIAKLVLTVSQNYTAEISNNQSSGWTDRRADKALEGVGATSNANKKEILFDVENYIQNGEVFFRIGDQTTGDGWGGILWQVKLMYTNYQPEITTPFEDKVDFSFIPGSALEKRFIPEGRGGGAIGSNGLFRYCDHSSTVTYRIPVDNKRKAFLNIVLAANFIVKISVDDLVYKVIDKAENGENAAGYGTENKGLRSYDIGKTVKDNIRDPGNYEYVYVKIGDQSTDNGWGGQIFFVGVHYGEDNGMYNPIVPAGTNSTGIRYKRPQQILTFKKVVEKQLVDDGLGDIPIDNSIDPVESVDSTIEEVPVSSTDIGWDNGTISSTDQGQQTDVTPVNDEPNWILIGILGLVGLILIGGAVTQFILMEKKRKGVAETPKSDK